MAGITALLALAFAPIYVGSAVGAFAFGSRSGAAALPIVFGASHVGILWVSLLIGALGRTFEMDKLKRYPFRPRDVFVINTLASLGEPVVLMTLPALVAVVWGVALHDGALAGLQAGVGALLLLLLTASLLQLLLALLDDLLRREWMRYVAAFLFTATILAIQLGLRGSSRRLAAQAREHGLSPERLVADLTAVFERVPTVAAPSTVGGAHLTGPWGEPLLALALCLVAIAVPTWLGARTMARAVTRETVAGGRRRPGRVAKGGFAGRWPLLSPAQALLVQREWLYLRRTPALLYQMLVVPLTVVFITVFTGAREPGYDVLLPAFVMTSTLAARNMMLWGYDGPGIRSFFLLPFSSRDLVLGKNVAWLATAFLEGAFTFAALTAVRPDRFARELPLLVPAFAALAFASAVVGTWVSIAHPTKPRERGLARRGPGGLTGILAYFAVLVMAAALVLTVLAARSLTPEPFRPLAGPLTALVALVLAAGVWWIGLERHADSLERSRERLITVLARTSDD